MYGYNQNNQILQAILMKNAIKNNYLEIVKYLLENGCPLCNDIMYQCYINNKIDILIYLFEDYKITEKVNINNDINILLNYFNKINSKNLCYDYIMNIIEIINN